MTPAPETELFTAAQMARALGVTTRAVKLRLAKTAATGTVTVRGQTAKAWKLAALPESLASELSALATKRGLVSVAELFAAPVAPYSPAVAWHLIPAPFRDRAEKLRDALAPALEKQHELSGPDLMTMASAVYRQQFGHELSADKLRYLMDRATRRDAGAFQFHRADLYLDEAAFRPAPEGRGMPALSHHELNDQVKRVSDKSNPSLDDRAHVFHAAFVHFEKLMAGQPATGGAVKQSLVEYLYRNVPGLYRPRTATLDDDAHDRPLLALAALFDRRHAEWIANGRKLHKDRRAGKSGRKGYQCDDCEGIIRRTACDFRGPQGKKGNVELAVQKLLIHRSLCATCIELLSRRPLPPAMRLRCTPNELQVAYTKGPEFVRAIGPTHHCDWSDTAPGDRFVIDDMTTNELSWDEVDGKII